MGRLAALLLAAACLAPLSRAGAPYATDDPEPVDYRHFEIYVASLAEHTPGDTDGIATSFEINYGILPDTHLHIMVPLAFDAAAGEPARAGVGDTEIAVKRRLIDETETHPQVAVYPTVELPTGSSARGLGAGHTQVYLPLWMQKGFGKWTTYGGGGYWINPGAGNRNWVFVGWHLERQVLPNLSIGAEVYHEGSRSVGAAPDTRANLGLVWDLSESSHLLASAGPVVRGPAGYQVYLGWQFTQPTGK